MVKGSSLLLSLTFIFCSLAEAATQTIAGHVAVPEPFYIGSTEGDVMTVDAANEEAAYIYQVPKTGEIAKIGFLTETVTTGCTVDVRLETVSDTTGDPTGTLKDTNSNAALVIDDTDDRTYHVVSLTASATVTIGDILATVIVNPAASFCNMTVTEATAANFGNSMAIPYSDLFTGSWAKDDMPVPCYVEYDDGTTASTGCDPIQTIATVTFNSGDTPDERGLIFQLPFPVSAIGFWLFSDLDNDPDIVLYDSDGSTVLDTVSFDSNQRGSTTSDLIFLKFSSAQSLSKDTNYRLALKPGASDMRSSETSYVSTAVMDSTPGGSKFHLTTRANGGSWTETTTTRPAMGLLIGGFDDGAGAAGGAGGWGF